MSLQHLHCLALCTSSRSADGHVLELCRLRRLSSLCTTAPSTSARRCRSMRSSRRFVRSGRHRQRRSGRRMQTCRRLLWPVSGTRQHRVEGRRHAAARDVKMSCMHPGHNRCLLYGVVVPKYYCDPVSVIPDWTPKSTRMLFAEESWACCAI